MMLAVGLLLAAAVILFQISRPACVGAGAGVGGAAIVVLAGLLVFAVFALLVQRTRNARLMTSRLLDEARRNEARMMGIIRSSLEAIITIDEAQKIVIFNPTAEHVFGVPASDAIGTPLSRFIPERFRKAHAEHVADFTVTGASDRRMGAQRVLFGLRANGEEFPLEASISQIEEDSGKLCTVILRDVTERIRSDTALKQSKEELQLLSANLQNIQEEEKASLARELHDDFGQRLTALKMGLTVLQQTLAENDGYGTAVDDSIPDQVRDMFGMVDSMVASLRRMAADLRPTMLDDLGLIAAVEWLAQDFTRRYGIDIVRRIDPGNAVYSKTGATALFRIVQEALNNVARHSEATAVVLTLFTGSTHCVLKIADNGRGAIPRAMVNGRRGEPVGLIGVRERARTLGGYVQIDSAEKQGFALTVTFPLQSVQQEGPTHD